MTELKIKVTRRCKQGFGLASSLLGLAIISISGLALANLLGNSRKGMQTVSSIGKNQDTSTLLRMVLAKPSLCAEAFRNSSNKVVLIDPVKPTSVSSIVAGTQVVYASPLPPIQINKTVDLDVGNHEYIFEIAITYKNPGAYGGETRVQKIPLYVKLTGVAPPYIIQQCSTAESLLSFSSRDACLSIGFNWIAGVCMDPSRANPYGCVSNIKTGIVTCASVPGAGCASNIKTGIVTCASVPGAGCASNINTGIVTCASVPGAGCASNIKTGIVSCSQTPGGTCASNISTGIVTCSTAPVASNP